MTKAHYIFFILFSTLLLGCNLSKGYDALAEYNYFEAKKRFEKAQKKDSSIASYGLALIYERTDNPFTNIDSAYTNIQRALDYYNTVKPEKVLKYKKYGFEQKFIVQHRQDIATVIFDTVKKYNSIPLFNQFISDHSYSSDVDSAVYLRDAIAYKSAKVSNVSSAYKQFLTTYPNSIFVDEIQQDFYRTEYEELTANNSITEYIYFIAEKKDNPYHKKAEDELYALSTVKNTIQQQENFILSYPENSNINQAWMNLYNLSTENYSTETLNSFKSKYPNFPFEELISKDLELIKVKLLPYKIESKYGFINFEGDLVIPAQYESATSFKEGLSVVEQFGKFGFITKNNEVLIQPKYDDAFEFENGRAIVEMNGKFGMIDRTGKEIVPIHFEDIGPLKNDLFYAKKDSLFGYYDKFGYQRIKESYEEAFSFKDGKAQVIVDGKVAFIDEYGSFITPPAYEDLKEYAKDIFIVEEDEGFGLVSYKYEPILEPKFDYIGALQENRALVVTEDGIGFLNEKGKVAIAPKYQEFSNFKEFGKFKNGYAKVKLKDKFGMIDSTGNIILPMIFEDLGEYNSYISISKGKGWGYTDSTSKLRIPYMYEFAESFKNGVGIVQHLTQYGVINKKNEFVIPANYADISFLTDTLLLLSTGSKFGIADINGKIIVPVEYQQIKLKEEDLLILSKSGAFNYFYIPEQKFITLKIGG